MTKETLAALLNGREYGSEITQEEAAAAKAAGLVVIFGYSDDNMEIRGAIFDELSCCDGMEFKLNRNGLAMEWVRWEDKCEGDARAYFEDERLPSVTICAIWGSDGYSWTYDAKFPHSTFDVMEDGEKYCRGIVFSLAEVLPCISDSCEQNMAIAYKDAVNGKPMPEKYVEENGRLLFELGYIAGQQAALKEVRATLRSPATSPFSSNTTSN